MDQRLSGGVQRRRWIERQRQRQRDETVRERRLSPAQFGDRGAADLQAGLEVLDRELDQRRASVGGQQAGLAADVEYWPTPDPTGTEGSREQKLAAYREVMDGLLMRIRRRFSRAAAASG